MGEIASALVKGIGSIQAAKQSIGSNGADQSDPGVQLPDPNAAQMPSMPDFGQGGQSQSQPSMLQSLLAPQQGPAADLYAPEVSQPAPAAPQAPADNPYTPYDNAQSPAANIGSEDDTITVTGDGWKPPAKEGWLGKTMDVLEMLRGRGTPFKDRVDNKNISSAMQGFQSHPEEAIARIARISPAAAERLTQTMSAVAANKALEAQRQDELKQGQVTQIQNQISAVLGAKKPQEVYTKVLPVLNQQAENAGLPAFDPKFDEDTLGVFAKSGMTPYQQGALAHDEKSTNATIANQQVEQQLSRERLGVSQYEAKTGRMNAETERANSLKKPDKSDKPVTMNVFHSDGSVAGTMSPDGMTAALIGPDGQAYAFRLRKKGDINSRVRSAADDAALRAAMAKAAGQ